MVQDIFSTHTAGALYETSPPEEAHRLLQRLEFHYQRVDEIGGGARRHKMLAHKSPMRRYMLRHS